MSDARLQQSLLGNLTPQYWYELLNGKVFFWATRERLYTLLNARHYRSIEHDVLSINTQSFVEEYRDRIELCHMNSGNTFPVPHRRDETIFKAIPDYPSRLNGAPEKEVAEVTVEYSVPTVARHVMTVDRMRGAEVLRPIYP